MRSILLWHGEMVSAGEVSAWCQEIKEGCWLDLAVDGLRQEGFDVEAITSDVENAVRATVSDPDDPQPVLVTIRNPAFRMAGDHAVVLLGIEPEPDSATGEAVFYADPLTGEIEADTIGAFWEYWDYADQRAYIIRP